MTKIKLLPKLLIAKIAAGEVIERPVFAVKELIENALDARATEIRINIEQGGLKKIEVTDNGIGMSKEDLELSFLPHTTSKIFKDEDLLKIQTYGFRGEALSSIAAISNLQIQSRTKDSSAGNQILIDFGKAKKVIPVGIPVGTTVLIQNLFSNIPARKKFLKSNQSEWRQILDIVSSYALANLNVRFILTHNKKLIFDLLSNQSLIERTTFILGKTISENALPINFEETYLKSAGLLIKPQITTNSPQKQYLYINGRRVTDKLISQAVKDAFSSMLPKTSYPIFILFLKIPYEIVDVNVHPRKETVSFTNANMIYDFTKLAITETLQKSNLTFINLNWKQSSLLNQTDKSSEKFANTESFAGKLLRGTTLPWEVTQLGEINKKAIPHQLHNLYIVIESKSGILLIDQHAAHERILYEKLQESYQKQSVNNNPYILPQSLFLNLSLSEQELVLSKIDYFSSLGFEIEQFDKETIKISSIPLLLKGLDIKQIFLEIVEDIIEDKKISLQTQVDSMLKYLACHSAVRSGDQLTLKQIKHLISELEKTPNNYTCPHGRPTKIEISLTKINQSFRR